jgi:hypothetical protein
MWINLVLALAVLTIVGCSGGSPPDESQIQEAVADQLQNIQAMTNQGHPPEKASALYLDYFSANPIVLPYGGKMLVGKDEVADFYAEVFSMGTIISNSYTNATIGIADEYVVRIYEGTAEFQPFGEEEIFSYTNVYTDVLVYEDGKWKIQWHSWVRAPAD